MGYRRHLGRGRRRDGWPQLISPRTLPGPLRRIEPGGIQPQECLDMMNDWNKYRESLIEKVGEFGKVNPDVLRGLGTIDGAATKSGHL